VAGGRNGIGLVVFLLIKISNLTPECAVFNETASGPRAGFSHYSRGRRAPRGTGGERGRSRERSGGTER